MQKALFTLRQADALLQAYDHVLVELSRGRAQFELERSGDPDVKKNNDDTEMANRAARSVLRQTEAQLKRIATNICTACNCDTLDEVRFLMEELGALKMLQDEQVKIIYTLRAKIKYFEQRGIPVSEEWLQELLEAETIFEGTQKDIAEFDFGINMPSDLITV